MLRAAILLAMMYWFWVLSTIQTSFRQMSTAGNRLVIFGLTFTALLMALAIPAAFEERGLLFAGAYWSGRALVFVTLARRTPAVRPVYAVSLLLTGPLLVAGALLESPYREVLWAAAALAEILAPRVNHRRMRTLVYDLEHIVERFGLLVIIALGETIISTGEPLAEAMRFSLPEIITFTAAFVLTISLWWLYFDHSATYLGRHLESAPVTFEAVRGALTYTQFWIVGGVIAVAVGVHESLLEPLEPLPVVVGLLMLGGTTAFYAVFTHLRFTVTGRLYRSRILGVLGCLVLAVGLPWLPAAGVMVGLAVLTVATNVWERLHPASAGAPSGADWYLDEH